MNFQHSSSWRQNLKMQQKSVRLIHTWDGGAQYTYTAALVYGTGAGQGSLQGFRAPPVKDLAAVPLRLSACPPLASTPPCDPVTSERGFTAYRYGLVTIAHISPPVTLTKSPPIFALAEMSSHVKLIQTRERSGGCLSSQRFLS